MTVETTIQHLFDVCPEFNRTREDCLCHLFCMNGNGYTWKWGQLVNKDDLLFGGVTREDHETDYRTPAVRRAKMSEEGRARIAGAGRGCTLDASDFDNNSSVALHVMPPDAKPDWKAAAEECRRLMRKFGIDPDEVED